jgi:hydroxypyruvate isomerase
MSIQQSICYPCFSESGRSLDELCAAAAETGYAAIELWSPDDTLGDIVETAKRHGLVVCSFTGHDSIEKGLNDEREHDRIEAELRASIDNAAQFGIPGVICFSGGRHGDRTDLDGLATFAKGIRRIAPYAEEKGVNLNLEILNSKVDHPGYQCDRVDWAIAACELANSPRVKMLFDVYHVQIMEGDVIRNLRKAMPYIGHIHTAGNPGRHDLQIGEMNYRAISEAIAEAGYTGYMGHEFFTSSGDRLGAMRRAFEICNV